MEFIETYWWLWLLGLAGSIGYMLVKVFTEFKKNKDKFVGIVKNATENISDLDKMPTLESIVETANDTIERATECAWKLLAAQFVALISGILLVIAIILKVASYLPR